MDSPVPYNRTRIAPTPSGFLHLGNAYSFALTAAMARNAGASIFLRIDDLDQPRAKPEFVQDVFDTLQFLDIPWDEGPRNAVEFYIEFSQLKRMDLYRKALQELKDGGHVFACSCTRTTDRADCTCREKNLSLDEEGLAWRMRTDALNEAVPEEMQEFIVKKKDGFPAYQLTSLVDDCHFGIDFIVRGEDLRPSSAAQTFLAQKLGYTSFLHSTILHHPLLTDADKQKLSKSAGSTSIQFLRKQGKTREDVYNMIAQLAGLASPVHNYESLARAGRIF